MTTTEVELWAVHIKGPDDIIPMRSKEFAVQVAAQWGFTADAVRWPYSAESHAAGVEEPL